MSATRANALPIEPASAMRETWCRDEIECADCGALHIVVFKSGDTPDLDECNACGGPNMVDHDGKRRDWRVIH